MSWDWSVAGRMGPDGKPIEEFDARGSTLFDSKKGAFVLGENVVPEYVWFNSKVNYALLGDKVVKGSGYTPNKQFGGSPNDGTSRIWPVKVCRGVQPFDTVKPDLDRSAYQRQGP